MEAIKTGSSAQIYTAPSLDDVEDCNFLFLSADLRESGVTEQVSKLLAASGDACTVLFAEGPADEPENFVDDVNLLFPVAVTEGDGRQFVSSTIADLFECMLRPTVRELGKGDILEVVGENRVGEVFIDNFEDTSQSGDLTPTYRVDSVDTMLLFVCYDGPYPSSSVNLKVQRYERPQDGAYLWDPRTQSRYEDRAHIKRIIASDTDRETMTQLLKKEVPE